MHPLASYRLTPVSGSEQQVPVPATSSSLAPGASGGTAEFRRSG